jgi:glycosyltransferase involved in cell wall biosynthesis
VVYKQKFINTCTALLHARERGETFGISVAEFAIKGKPVITYANSPEQNHILELGENAYYYTNKNNLTEILLDSVLNLSAKESYEKFSPKPVMEKFKEVFMFT